MGGKPIMSKRALTSLKISALNILFGLVVVGVTQATPGTITSINKGTASASTAAASSTSITPFDTETGKISVSLDAIGTNDPSGGTVQAQKPEGGTVRKAYLAAATVPGGGTISNTDITLDGTAVTFTTTVNCAIGGNNYLADV